MKTVLMLKRIDVLLCGKERKYFYILMHTVFYNVWYIFADDGNGNNNAVRS